MNSLINEIAKYILNEYEIKINKNKIKNYFRKFNL